MINRKKNIAIYFVAYILLCGAQASFAQDITVDFNKPIQPNFVRMIPAGAYSTHSTSSSVTELYNHIDSLLTIGNDMSGADFEPLTIKLIEEKSKEEGKKSAMYYGLRTLLDIPVARYSVQVSNPSLDGMATADEHKACLLLWNNSAQDEKIFVRINHVRLPRANYRLYRIDRKHASCYDGADNGMKVVQSNFDISTENLSWSGNLPGKAAIYIRIDDEISNKSNPFEEPAVPVKSDHGIRGEYFNTMDFTQPALTRIDSTINFDWLTGSPDSAVHPDFFSVRWTGEFVPLYSENYTFIINSNNGRRLWINDSLLIDNWDSWDVEHTCTLHLTAGKRYHLRVEYFERELSAWVKLEWQSNSQKREVIPVRQLYYDPKSQ